MNFTPAFSSALRQDYLASGLAPLLKIAHRDVCLLQVNISKRKATTIVPAAIIGIF
jgi:hypothetical protein